MSRRPYRESDVQRPGPIRADGESNPGDFDVRMHWLFLSLFDFGWDSVLEVDLELTYIRVCCHFEDKTEPIPVTPKSLDDAIRNYPSKKLRPDTWSAKSCFYWSGHFGVIVRDVIKRKHSGFSFRSFENDPQEEYIHKGDTRAPEPGLWRTYWAGEGVLEYTPGHWGCILSDATAYIDKRPNRPEGDEYFLRSELLACVALLRRQMNKTIWADGPPYAWEFLGWELNMEQGPIKVTVVNFSRTGARVVQASCDPSSPSPSLDIALLATYHLGDGGKAGVGTDVAHKILRWLLGADHLLASPGSPGTSPKGQRALVGKKTADSARVVSSGSETSTGTSNTTASTVSVLDADE